MFGSSRSGAGRRSTGLRVVVGLSPVLLLTGLFVAEKVSALTGQSQSAGSAVVALDEPVPQVVAAPPPAAPARTERSEPDIAAEAEKAAAGGLPARGPGDGRQQFDKGKLFSAPSTPVFTAPADPVEALPTVVPDERRRPFEGWRSVAERNLAPAEDRPEAQLAHWAARDPEPATITTPQPTWNSGAPADLPDAGADRPRSFDPPEEVDQGTSSMSVTAEPVVPPVRGSGLLHRARVVVHRPRDDAAEEARALLDRLGARGVGQAEIRTVGVNVSRPDVRYFHPADRPIAEEVLGTLRRQGYSPVIRDFTNYKPRPSRGSVEVWLPG